MSDSRFNTAYRTPTIYSDDTETPFRDIGMGEWDNDQIGEFFEGKHVIDIGSGFEGLARRLFVIFKDSKDAPKVVNLNPQFSDWSMRDVRIDGVTTSVKQSKKASIEEAMRRVMEDSGEDFEGYMAQRVAVAGIVQSLEFDDGTFDIQVSTWAFPNVLYDCGGSKEYGLAGYREILRTQKPGGVALLAPITQGQQAHVIGELESTGLSYIYDFTPATPEGTVLELHAN